MTRNLIKRKYYTFRDFLKAYQYTDSDIKAVQFGDAKRNKVQPQDVFEKVTGLTDTAEQIPSQIKSATFKTLWYEHILPRCLGMCVTYSDDDAQPDYEGWYQQFCYVLFKTYDRYNKLISVYAAEANNLMSAVGTTTTHKFNDTPQDSGSFIDNTHMSTYSESTSSNDMMPKILRLEEIRKYWDDQYDAWMYEFKGLFFYE